MSWKTRHGKHSFFNENPKKQLKHMNRLVIGICPFCGGVMGVDETYLEQVDEFIHCPMCCEEFEISIAKEKK